VGRRIRVDGIHLLTGESWPGQKIAGMRGVWRLRSPAPKFHFDARRVGKAGLQQIVDMGQQGAGLAVPIARWLSSQRVLHLGVLLAIAW